MKHLLVIKGCDDIQVYGNENTIVFTSVLSTFCFLCILQCAAPICQGLALVLGFSFDYLDFFLFKFVVLTVSVDQNLSVVVFPLPLEMCKIKTAQ